MGEIPEEINRRLKAKSPADHFQAIRNYIDPLDAEFVGPYKARINGLTVDGYPSFRNIYFDPQTGTVTAENDDDLPSKDLQDAITAIWPQVLDRMGSFEPQKELSEAMVRLTRAIRRTPPNRVHIYPTATGLIHSVRTCRYHDYGKSFATYTPWTGGIWRNVEAPGLNILYGLPEIADAKEIWIHEGEASVDECNRLKAGATQKDRDDCDAHPFGEHIKKAAHTTWPNGTFSLDKTDWEPVLKAKKLRRIVMIPDNDLVGEAVPLKLTGILARCKAKKYKLEWPDEGVPASFDLANKMPAIEWPPFEKLLMPLHDVRSMRSRKNGMRLRDFIHHRPNARTILTKNGELWVASTLENLFPKVPLFDFNGAPLLTKDGKERSTTGASWLKNNNAVDGMTWDPGAPPIIEDKLAAKIGFLDSKGSRLLNLYIPPKIHLGKATGAQRWLDLFHYNYGDTATHAIKVMAFKAQNPGQKVNHALVFGGNPGIGKDTLITGFAWTIGDHNFEMISPDIAMASFNPHWKAVAVLISENKESKVDIYILEEFMKQYTASPPYALYINDKNEKRFYIVNVCLIIYTTNHRTKGVHFKVDDRRHYPMWSNRTEHDEYFADEYFPKYFRWFNDEGGKEDIAAYLHEYDLSGFDPKASPPRTQAFWDIVNAQRAPEDDEMADALELLKNPAALTIQLLRDIANEQGPMGVNIPNFGAWLGDRRNAYAIAHRLEEAGYHAVDKPGDGDGRWKVRGQNCRIYARKEMDLPEQIAAAKELIMVENVRGKNSHAYFEREMPVLEQIADARKVIEAERLKNGGGL